MSCYDELDKSHIGLSCHSHGGMTKMAQIIVLRDHQRILRIIFGSQVAEGNQGNLALSIEIVIRPDSGDEKGFRHILTLRNGDDDSQLVMGQYYLYHQ
jgi:hypothetical protein